MVRRKMPIVNAFAEIERTTTGMQPKSVSAMAASMAVRRKRVMVVERQRSTTESPAFVDSAFASAV
jgi:hypothetical protein